MSGAPDQQGQGPPDRPRPEKGPGRHRATPAEPDQPDRYRGPPSHPYPGDPYAGNPYPGDPYAGNPYPGDEYLGAASNPDPHVDSPPGPVSGARPGRSAGPQPQPYPLDRYPDSPDAARQEAAADPYRGPSADAEPLGHGSRLAPGQMHPGPSEIPGPMPVMPPDHPAVSGPTPSVTAKHDPFPGQDDDRHLQDDYHPDGDDPDEAYGWQPEAGGCQRADRPDWPWLRAGNAVVMGPRPRGRRFSAPLIALLVLAVFLAGAGVVGYHFLRQYVIPPDYSGVGDRAASSCRSSRIETATDVAKTLFGLGVVASTRAFVKAAEQSSQQTALEPGFYRLHRHMKAALAFDLLLNPGSPHPARGHNPRGPAGQPDRGYAGREIWHTSRRTTVRRSRTPQRWASRLREEPARGLSVPRHLFGAATHDRDRRAARHGRSNSTPRRRRSIWSAPRSP